MTPRRSAQSYGAYVSIERFHLFRYVDEQTFRFNNRNDMNDSDRFGASVSQIVGKRLRSIFTFASLGTSRTSRRISASRLTRWVGMTLF